MIVVMISWFATAFMFYLHCKAAYRLEQTDEQKVWRYRGGSWILLAGPLLIMTLWATLFSITITAEKLGYSNSWKGSK